MSAGKSRIVYSTDPNFKADADSPAEKETLAPGEQKLQVRVDRKHRGGKTVTLVEGFSGRAADLEELGRKLKNHCGTGGSAKDSVIIIQGDHREKIIAWLKKNTYMK